MATVKKSEPAVQRKALAKGQAPIAPEAGGGAAIKRKRLAKVFKRPLDKTLRSVSTVRDKFSMPASEYEQLFDLKQKLSDIGLVVKKSELVRAGLQQLADLDESDLKDALVKVQLLS